MPNTPNASFIPKQGPAKKSRYVASNQLRILTVVSYVLFMATILAAGGLYLYIKFLNKQLDTEVQTLNSDIAGFNEKDMDDVREFNFRLSQAESRLNKAVSLTALFGALEEATAQSVQIDELNIMRNEDTNYLVSAKLKTDSFDSALFQRSLLEKNKVADSVEVSDLNINAGDKNQTQGVSFLAKINVPLTAVPYDPAVSAASVQPEPLPVPPVSTSTPVVDTTASSSKTKTP